MVDLKPETDFDREVMVDSVLKFHDMTQQRFCGLVGVSNTYLSRFKSYKIQKIQFEKIYWILVFLLDVYSSKSVMGCLGDASLKQEQIYFIREVNLEKSVPWWIRDRESWALTDFIFQHKPQVDLIHLFDNPIPTIRTLVQCGAVKKNGCILAPSSELHVDLSNTIRGIKPELINPSFSRILKVLDAKELETIKAKIVSYIMATQGPKKIS